jgi:hypothetical protein
MATDTPPRKTVPLTPEEAALIDLARRAGTPQHRALVHLAGADAARSEAATLHALVSFALTALGEQIALDDYERLAAAKDEEDAQYEETMRRRTRDR